MWTDSNRNEKSKGGQIEVFKIMVMKILILIFFFEIKESKITRGHYFTLVKKQRCINDKLIGC